MTLHEEIGRNLYAVSTSLIFEIKVMKFVLKACKMDLDLWDYSTTSQISLQIIGHPTWKKSVVKPSGDGDFP
jgi:hypothetical protein